MLHSRLIQITSQSAFFMPIFVHSQSRKKDWLLNFSEEGGNHMTKCKVIALQIRREEQPRPQQH